MENPHRSHRNVRKIHVPGALSPQVPSVPGPPNPALPGTPIGKPTLPSSTPNLPDPAQVEQMSRNVQRQVHDLLLRLQGINLGANALKQSELSQAKENLSQVQGRVSKMQVETANRVKQKFKQTISSAADTFNQEAKELAPGVNGAAVSSLAEEALSDFPLSPYMRIGSLEVNDNSVPALVPFLGKKNWWVDGPAQQSREMILAILARVAASVPLKHLRILVFDPRITASLGALSPLRAINGDTFPQAFSNPETFADELEKAMQATARNAEVMAVQGAQNLLDLWENSSVPEGKIVVAVLLDHPYGIKERLQKIVERAAEVGPASGLSLIVQNDPALKFESNGVTSGLGFTRLQYEESCWRCEEHFGSNVNIRHEGAIPTQTLTALMEVLTSKASKIQGPTYPLFDLIKPVIANPWKQTSTDGLSAIVGKAGRQDLTVSFRSENPPTPNMLVGGAVGQGKSNLLLDIIFSLTAQYSPDELELLLLDFKRGLEFKRFDKDGQGKNWMPHVRVLSLESNQEFGIAVLKHVETELERRSQLFKAADAHSITDYRKSGEKLPRILLIIDEFHILFEGDDANVDEAVRILELIAKQGRAYGIHLLLASQTTSGISGLRVKGESIFAQFPLRMSLKNTVQESQAILAMHNKAAADLTYRGEVIFNKNFGQDPLGSNIRGVAAWVDSDKFSQVQEELWKLGHDDPPMVFIGSEYATWDESQFAQIHPREDEIVEAWVGRPIAITNRPYVIELDSDTNQGIAMVGTGDDEGAAVLSSVITTVMKTLGEQGKLVVLCGLNALPNSVQTLLTRLENSGTQVEVIRRKEVPEYLVNQLAPSLENGQEIPTFVVGLGMQRIPGMEKTIFNPGDDFSLDFSAEAPANTGNAVVAKMAQKGALQKLFFLGWWSSLQGVTDCLGYSRTGVGKYLLLKVGIDDVKEVAGPLSTITSDHPRVTVIDKGSDEGLVTLVPFGQLPENMGE